MKERRNKEREREERKLAYVSIKILLFSLFSFIVISQGQLK